MRICIIVSHYYPHIGGIEIATEKLANALSKHGHDVHIITPEPNSKLQGDKNQYGITIHRLPALGYPTGRRYCDVFLGIIFYIKAVIELLKLNPNIIHCQNIMNTIPACILYFLHKTNYHICLHGDCQTSLDSVLLPPLLQKYWYKLPYIKYATSIIALTANNKYELLKLLPDSNIVHIPNGVDLEKKTIKVRTERCIENPIIITVSRIDKKKGLEYAIQSIPLIHKCYPNTKLRIVGDGEHRKYLEELTEKNGLSGSVEFVGFLPHDEIPNHLRNADLFLLPSLTEGLPLTLLEAMACGLPVISTPVSIAPEIIENWNNGIIVPFKSPEGIAEAVISIISNYQIRVDYGENSWRAISDFLSWDDIAQKYDELYSKK